MKSLNTYLAILLVLLVSLSLSTVAVAGDFQARSTTGAIQVWDSNKVSDGCLIELIKTTDAKIDTPNADSTGIHLGETTGDDVLLRTTYVGNGYIAGFSEGRFSKLFSHEDLVPGTHVYIRVWDVASVSSNNDSYGDSDIYTIQTGIPFDEFDFGTIQLLTYVDGSTHPVELTSFAAACNGGKVELTWSTLSETQNLGYYIFRSETANGNNKEKMNEKMISGALNSEIRNDYSFIDVNVQAEKEYFYWLADVSTDGVMNYYGPISILVTGGPKTYALNQNYPNPFNPTTMISYNVKKDGFVSLVVYNMLGQIVQEIVNHNQIAGSYSVQWDGTNTMGVRVPSGVYFYAIEVNGFTATRKMMLTK